jgi:heme/copper-type cytochrome/quinol oxidase subunit 1
MGAAGLEWMTSSPPPTFNFDEPPVVTWDSHDYDNIPVGEELSPTLLPTLTTNRQSFVHDRESVV